MIKQAKAEWAKSHPAEQPKQASGGTYTSRPVPTMLWRKADTVTAKADPKDPNADLNVLLGITDN